jgi:hypothetical protein
MIYDSGLHELAFRPWRYVTAEHDRPWRIATHAVEALAAPLPDGNDCVRVCAEQVALAVRNLLPEVRELAPRASLSCARDTIDSPGTWTELAFCPWRYVTADHDRPWRTYSHGDEAFATPSPCGCVAEAVGAEQVAITSQALFSWSS